MIRAGRLNRRVAIQTPQTVRSTRGGREVGWTEVATVWAEVVDLSGRELMEAEQGQSRAQVRVRMRHRAGLSAEQRLVCSDRTLEITNVIDPTGRGRELICLCVDADQETS